MPMFAFHKPLRDPSEIKPGDIIGFSGQHWKSAAISFLTYGIPYWSLSHVGIVGEHDGRLLFFESTENYPKPCEILGKCINGTQAHDLDTVIADYIGRVWHYSIYRPLFEHERERLSGFLHATLGIPYDTIGAFRAGGLGYSWLEARFSYQDLSSLFCSEWCAAAHAEVGVFSTDNVSRWNPSLFVRTERRAGILQKPRRLK